MYPIAHFTRCCIGYYILTFFWIGIRAAVMNDCVENVKDGLAGMALCPTTGKTLFDFSKVHDLDDWEEQSDVVREVGKSKASFTLQKTRVFQRAVFFSLLNPQPNGACFAGVRTDVQWDLSPYMEILLRLRGQGENQKYKVCLRHHGENNEPYYTYEQIFTAPQNFEEIHLPLDDFKPYYRGRLINTTDLLDKTNITNFEFQIFGGVYLPYKQSGVSALEIDWIKVN